MRVSFGILCQRALESVSSEEMQNAWPCVWTLATSVKGKRIGQRWVKCGCTWKQQKFQLVETLGLYWGGGHVKSLRLRYLSSTEAKEQQVELSRQREWINCSLGRRALISVAHQGPFSGWPRPELYSIPLWLEGVNASPKDQQCIILCSTDSSLADNEQVHTPIVWRKLFPLEIQPSALDP